MTQQKGRKVEYERMSERAKRGEYTLVEPLDYLILEQLPEQGELVMGYYPHAETARGLTKKFKGLTVGMITAALSRLKIQGLTQNVIISGISTKGSGWQRTPLGRDLYAKWKNGQGPGPSGTEKEGGS